MTFVQLFPPIFVLRLLPSSDTRCIVEIRKQTLGPEELEQQRSRIPTFYYKILKYNPIYRTKPIWDILTIYGSHVLHEEIRP
jgi:hypothetical protein